MVIRSCPALAVPSGKPVTAVLGNALASCLPTKQPWDHAGFFPGVCAAPSSKAARHSSWGWRSGAFLWASLGSTATGSLCRPRLQGSPSLLSPVGTTPRTTLFLPSKLSNLFRRLWPLLIQLGHFAGRTHSPDEAFPQYKAIFHCWGCQLGAVFATQCPTQWFIPKM